MPCTIEDLLQWKASELKNWSFYYYLPVLEGVMQGEYFDHFSLFIAGISLLNSESITHENVNKASNLLHKFVREFEVMYGLKIVRSTFILFCICLIV